MIGTNNECEVVDGKYEYAKTQLTGLKSKNISIPLSIITDTELDAKRVGVLSYLKIHCGLNDVIGFTIPDMVEWCGGKPDRRANGSNDKFLNVVDLINDMGYLTYIGERSKSSYMKCKFDTKYYYDECSDGYAVLYLDEIEKIVKYKKEESKNDPTTNTTMLLVFAYLRNKIFRRPNELKPEERSPEKIKDRRKRIPEAFNANFVDIAEDIGISTKTLLKAINILEQELGLIVTERSIYKTKNSNGEYRTPPTIFANAYKREDKYLLDTGESYSKNEIELKVERIKKYYKNYEINY